MRTSLFKIRLRGHWLLVSLGTLTAVLLLLPVGYLVIRAAQGGWQAWQLFTQPYTWLTVWRTLALVVTVTLTSLIIGTILAWLLSATDLYGRRILGLLLNLPLVLPSYVSAYLFIAVWGTGGLLAEWIPVAWSRSIFGFGGAWLVLSLMCYPIVFLNIRVAWQRVDPALTEAARSLGYTPWQSFWRVVVPQLRPTASHSALLVALYVMRDFGAVALLRYTTFTRAIYLQYETLFNRSQAAALAIPLVLVTLLLTHWEMRSRQQFLKRSGSGSPRQPTMRRLGYWQIPLLLGCALLFLLGLGLPLVGLGFWIWRAVSNHRVLNTLGTLTLNSLQAAGWATVLIVAWALPLSVWLARYRNQATRWLEQVLYVGYALPGVVLALGLVFIGAQYVPILYQTWAWLMLGYALSGLPEMVGTVRAALTQVRPSLEESARSLGLSPLAVLRRLTVPLIAPSILQSALLLFVTLLKELPLTLLLSPLGMRTLAAQIWLSVSQGSFSQAAPPTVLLLVLAAIPTAILEARAKR